MATAMEFNSLQELRDYVIKYYNQIHNKTLLPSIDTNLPYGYDSRVNQYLTGVKCDQIIVGFIFEEVK